MTCPADDLLSQFAEGELPDAERQRLALHTERCDACRRVVAALVKLRSSRNAGDAAPSAHLDLPGVHEGTVLGRYVLRRRVGAGAMGVVFEAHDSALDRVVALKVLRGAASAEAQARLAREAQVMAQLSHRNVATVHDVGGVDGRSWVAMEFIAGPTLRAWLAAEPRAPRDVLAVLLDAGRGLAAAHRQGLVHRDFKPDNVLVEVKAGAPERVVVTDFGLAESSGASGPEAPTLAAPLSTATGAVVGTPAYMAPEQFREADGAVTVKGGEASKWSDQFAFCVTCVEAFASRRPFDAPSLPALVTQLQTSPPDAATLARVPARQRRALERGLAKDPAARFPSMEALLAALTPPRRERQALVAAGVLATVALAAVGAGLWSRATVCRGAEDRVATAWSPAEAGRVREAFLATGRPWAAAAAQGLDDGLKAWAVEWTQAWTDACEDTHLRREQSDELLDLRLRCLEERLAEVKALGPVLAHADEGTLSAASNLVQRLSPVSVCADEKALKAPVRAPTDPAQSARVDAVRGRLSELVALRAAGRSREAMTQVRALADEVAALKYRPLEADVALLTAQLEEDTDDFDAALASLDRAQVAAQAGGHAYASGHAWALLVRVTGVKRGHYAEGHQAATLAEAVSEHLGSPRALEVLIARNVGKLLSEEGKHAEAKARLERALALTRQDDPASEKVAGALNALGAEVLDLGDNARALALHEEALALLTKRLGPSHPDVANVQKNIGNVHWKASELDLALEWYQRALALQEAALGPDSLEAASTRNNVATVLIRQSKLPEAEAALRSVIAVVEAKQGKEHPKLFGQLNNLAVVLRFSGRMEEAEAALRRALAVAEKAHGPENEDVATTLINLGDVQLARHDFVTSVASYERAAAITAKTSGPEHANLADCLGGMAFPLLQLKQFARALAATDQALAIYAKHPGMPYVEGLVHAAHAQAVWAVDPARRAVAVQEARAARETLVKSGAQPSELAELDEWLKSHRVGAGR